MKNQKITPIEFRRRVLEDIVQKKIPDWAAYYARVYNLYQRTTAPEWRVQLSLCLQDLGDMIIAPYMAANGYVLAGVDGHLAWVLPT